jgi:hypothetical protein
LANAARNRGAARELARRKVIMNPTRRQFLGTSMAGAVAAAAPTTGKDKISLASWSLVRSFRAGNWKNLDLPRILREDLGIGGLEYVNTFFENPTMSYLQQLKRNCADQGVTSVLIMVDNEGDTAALEKAERMNAAVAHRKWVGSTSRISSAAMPSAVTCAEDWRIGSRIRRSSSEPPRVSATCSTMRKVPVSTS